ncbi:hypothetical protein AVEN_188898-1 [Araneus ventricosus]|uniref:Uncharacterized protein n=1 Tax=Araneus ventricosus TaxID=182803 RepID=A0A4Y2P389_ARAVE|nr:hypothetical protein AVEN_188898-1 [Araneus ventricosus]
MVGMEERVILRVQNQELQSNKTLEKSTKLIDQFHQTIIKHVEQFFKVGCYICGCGGIGTALLYAIECIYTVSWHMRKPAPNFGQEWLKRVANNLVSRQRIRGIIKFMSENRDLFRPP